MSREIVLDTETTGLSTSSGHKIIEIGALELINRMPTGKKFHTYINPGRDVPDEAYRIHGISTAFLMDKPRFNDIADDFLKFIEGGVLVIHNSVFDIGFLNHELSMTNMPTISFDRVIDTLVIARRKFPAQRVSLDALCRRFKISLVDRDFHGALLDAKLLAKVYLTLTMDEQQLNLKVSKQQEVYVAKKNLIKTKVIRPSRAEEEKHKNFISSIV
jgi:DNA polymerase-3 subunit epsilon